MTVQSVIVGMILFKHLMGVKLGWGRTPLLSFLVKDSTSNYFAVFRESPADHQPSLTEWVCEWRTSKYYVALLWRSVESTMNELSSFSSRSHAFLVHD